MTDEAVSSDSESHHDENGIAVGGDDDDNVSRGQDKIQSDYSYHSIHPYIGGRSILMIQEAPHVNICYIFLIFIKAFQVINEKPVYSHTWQ
jgi:hypothetical protein